MKITPISSSPHSIATRTQSKSSSAPVDSSSAPIVSRTRSKHQALYTHSVPTDETCKKIERFLKFSTIPAHNSPTDIAKAVLDIDSGNILEYRQLIHHQNPKIQAI